MFQVQYVMKMENLENQKKIFMLFVFQTKL
jgi:hypothetical protein